MELSVRPLESGRLQHFQLRLAARLRFSRAKQHILDADWAKDFVHQDRTQNDG